MLTLLACHAIEKQAPGDAAGIGNDTGTGSDSADTVGTTDTAGATDTGNETGQDSATDTGEDTAWPVSKALCEILILDDLWADGHPESGYLSRVDASDKLQYEAYTDGDGVETTRLDYSYDGSGNLVVETHDLEADGAIDVTYTWTYDAWGNELTRVTSGLWDADYAWTYTYDAANDVLVAEYDGYGDATDGVIDLRVSFTRDTDGRPLTAAYDYDLDGDAELTVSRSWDAAGNALAETWDYDGLTDAWGTPYVDWSWTLTYDEDDNVLTSTYDTGADGLTPDVWTYTYADGLRATQDVDYAGDGVLDAQYRYIYDADGNQLTTELVDDGAWLPSEAYTWTDGRLARLEHFRDGALAWWSDYAWDEAGDPVEEVQYEASGAAGYRTSFSYDCP